MTKTELYREFAASIGQQAEFYMLHSTYAQHIHITDGEEFAYRAAVAAAHFGRLALGVTALAWYDDCDRAVWD